MINGGMSDIPPLFVSFFSVEAELDGAFEVFEVIFILAHYFAGRIGEFCNGSVIDILQFDNDVERFLAGVV